jgi:hypothetical protein
VAPDDVIIKMGDGVNPTTQLATVDTHGSQQSVIRDPSGNAIGDQLLSATYWLQVVQPANGPASPGTASAFSVLAGGIYNSTPETLTNGQQSALQLDSSGRLLVEATLDEDQNWGVVGATTLRTAAEIGNATGAANFNYGAINGQSLQTAAQLGNATGAIDYNWGTVDAQTIRVAAEPGNAAGIADFNWGAVGAQTLRVASQIGNATGAADFGAGATDAQTLRVTANQGNPNIAANAWPTYLTTGGVANSPTNPIFVSSSDTIGTPIDNYQTSAALAVNASATFDYTVSAGVTFYTKQFWATASGKIKLQVEYETAAGSGTFNTFWVAFNSTAETNILIPCPTGKTQVTGARIRMIVTNLDKAAMDVYSTLSGVQQ